MAHITNNHVYLTNFLGCIAVLHYYVACCYKLSWLVGWSLTSLFSTNTAISEISSYPVKED